MICETEISRTKGLLSEEEASELIEVLRSHYDKLEIDDASVRGIMSLLKHDKKNKDGRYLFSLIDSIGSAVYDQEISEKEVEEALKTYIHEL